MKKAFITGITGQDGSFLAEHLLGLGYEVYGLIRRNSFSDFGNAASYRLALSIGYRDFGTAYILEED